MNLQEYLTQENPTFGAVVSLTDKDYTVIERYNTAGKETALILIPKIHNYTGCNGTYIQKNGGSQLWTMDKDGNPKSLSCFYIN